MPFYGAVTLEANLKRLYGGDEQGQLSPGVTGAMRHHTPACRITPAKKFALAMV